MPRTRPKRPTGGITAPFPGFIEPALATSIDREPSGSRWVHEIKFDGYRVQVHLRDGAAKVFTRRGNDWTNRFRKIAADAWHINKRRLRDHRWGGGCPRRRRHHRLCSAAKRTERAVKEDRAGRVRSVVPQRLRSSVAGFALDGTKFDGIYLGRRKANDFVYAGKVDHGFDNASAGELQARLRPLIRDTQPYTKKIAHRRVWG